MECRLFPYSTGKISNRGGRVRIGFHSHTRCPEKKLLMASESEARAMILAFARDVFPDATSIVVEPESSFTLWRRDLRDRAAKLLGRH